MLVFRLHFVVWLLATPLFFYPARAAEEERELVRFTLEEDTTKVAAMLGAPAKVGEAGPHHFFWYLQLNVVDNHDHSHILLFRKEDKRLVSMTLGIRRA